jgi:hypothetical protein
MILPIAGILLCLLGAGVWMAIYQPFAQRQRLPDGTVLTLETATYGKKHTFPRYSWWQKLLKPVLPEQSPLLKTAEQRASYFDRDSLVYFFSANPSRSATMGRSSRLSLSGLQDVLVDDNGDWIGPLHGPIDPSQHPFTQQNCPVFPRRGQRVRMQLYEVGQPNPCAEFVIQNPAPGPYPIWTPEPLPITRRSGDLSVTLTGVTTGVFGKIDEMISTRVVFRVKHQGQPTDDWEPVASLMTDATGNSSAAATQHLETNGGIVRLQVLGGLPAREPAWKLRFDFARRATARFAASESWTVRHLALPQATTFLPLNAVATLKGATVRLLGLGGPGSSYDAYWHPPYPTPMARVQIDSLEANQRLILRAVDDHGREVIGSDNRPVLRPGGRQYDFRLRLPSDARTVDLTVSIDTTRSVEFLAKPTVYKPRAPANPDRWQ